MTIRRPRPRSRPTGLLARDHFQVAYATNDIDRAMGVFRATFGIREFRKLQGALPKGGHIHIELAWAGNVMYELLTASGPGSEPFVGALPTDGYALRHHHLGYLIETEEEWATMLADMETGGGTITHAGDTPGFMRTRIVEMPALGHALEFVYAEQAGIDFFDTVPVN